MSSKENFFWVSLSVDFISVTSPHGYIRSSKAVASLTLFMPCTPGISCGRIPWRVETTTPDLLGIAPHEGFIDPLLPPLMRDL